MGKPESNSMTSPMMSQVRVGIRVRPLTSKERGLGGKPVVMCDQYNKTVEISTSRFTYDFVLDSTVSQPQLYQTVSAPLLNSFVDGFNATVSTITNLKTFRINLNLNLMKILIFHW